MLSKTNRIKGRGASDNPVNRFQGHYVDYNDTDEEPCYKAPDTQLYRDDTKEIIAYNNSPDVPFNAGLNPYRGCEHGCIYCFARPFHEYLGFSSGLDFESKIMVKYNAPQLLRKQFISTKWKAQVVALSGITDVYQPIERDLEITRKCLKVFAEFRNPVGIITKNYLVTRDIDILQELATHNCVQVNISITTLEKSLSQKMEPRTSAPARRIQAIEKLAKAGIPVGVFIAPVVPGLTDHEIPSILKAAASAGANSSAFINLRLPFKVKDLFVEWLGQHFPDRKNRVLSRIAETRGALLTNAKFGERMGGKGNYFDQISTLFEIHSRALGLDKKTSQLTTQNFIKSHGTQLSFLE